MLNKVKATIEKYNMLKAGERILVGLSGGADSVSLSLCLKELGYDVCCVHLNHCFRGDESDRDEQFCKTFCNEQTFPLVSFRKDVDAYCVANKLSPELGARKVRYSCFSEALEKLGCEKIATAHTLSDCLETTLLNLTRGCSIKGLCGIPPVRDNIIRPLIDCTREEIESYLAQKSQGYVTDSTNLVDDCSRNILRLNVIPQLLRINDGLYKSYLTSLANFRTADEAIENAALSGINSAKLTDNSFDAEKIHNLKQPYSGTALSHILKIFSIEPSSERITSLLYICENGGRITLSKTYYAECKNNVLSILKDKRTAVQKFEVPFSESLKLEAFGKTFETMPLEISEMSPIVHKKFTKDVIDCDKIIGVCVVRNRRNGDKIRLAGRGVTSSVKTLFNADVSQNMRDGIFFIADSEGAIFIEGYGIAERVKPDENSKRCVKIKVVKNITDLSH